MSLLFLDSFDHYANLLDKWTQKVAIGGASASGTIDVSSGNGRRNTRSLRGTTAPVAGATKVGPAACIALPTSDSIGIIGFAFTTNANLANVALSTSDLIGAAGYVFFRVCQTGSVQFMLRPNIDATISAYRDGSAVPLGTTAQAFVASAWNYIECKWTSHATSGTLDLQVNGQSWLSLRGINTAPNGGTWNSILLGSPASYTGGAGGTVTADYDDLYICNGAGAYNKDFLGDVRIDVLMPNSDGTTLGWTVSTGTAHYDCVNETLPNSDSDYTSTASLNAKDTLHFAALPVDVLSGTQCLGVQLNMSGRKTDAGNVGVKGVTRIGATDYVGSGAEAFFSSDYLNFRQIWDSRPSDSSSWTTVDVNSAEFGYQRST